MGSRLVRFLSIVFIFLLYSIFEAWRIFPEQNFLLTVFVVLVLFVLMLAWQFMYRSKPAFFENSGFKILIWAGSLLMGFWGTFLMISLPLEILNLVLSQFIKTQGIQAVALAAAIVMTALGFIEMWRGPRVKEVAIPCAQLPEGLRGLKIGQISDLHVGPTIRKGYVQKVVRRLQALKPDIVVVTGDLADAKAESVIEHMQPLKGLRARYGVFYVTGNHEYYWGAEQLLEIIKQLDFVPLLNENRVLEIGGAKLMIAGVTDPMGAQLIKGHQPDLVKALQTSQKVDLKILLAHRPDICLEAEKLGVDVQFSGHTHAGQFFPFSLLISFFHQYYRDLNRHGKMWVYVNPGTGYWGPANRFAVAAEITLAKLEPIS